MNKNNFLKLLFGITILFVFSISLVYPASRVRLSFDHFYNHAELTNALKKLNKAYPRLMTLESIGKSFQGRDIWAVILNNPETGPAKHKPGFYIDGNIHGNEIQGTEVALYAIWYLLENHGKTEMATRLLDEKAFYVVPTMNPDSRDQFINSIANPDSPRTGLIPYDNDRDGVADEDGPEDLDGDGSITMMRKKDPNGNFRLHPDDPRIMVRVRPGEKGEYILLGQEGIDNDGDGRINEDGPGGYDMNRNYGFNWQPEYVQRGAGYYPFCWPETQAIRDFLLQHPNIAGAQNFHNFGGMILSGPGAKNMGEFPVNDKKIYEYIAKKGEKILPGYKFMVVYKDLYTVYGGSIDFLYNVLGIYTFTNELDMDPFESLPFGREDDKEEQKKDEYLARWLSLSSELKEMFYHDLVLLGEQYTDWMPYKHPLYGDIEIGGIKKFGQRVPPLFRLAETCHRNAAFCFFHADQLPRLHFDGINVKKIGKNLFQIDVSVKNSRVTPTISAVAFQKKLHRADRFRIGGKNAKLITAGFITDRFRGLTKETKCRENFFWVSKGIPSFGSEKFRLVVKGTGNIVLTYDSLKGGYIEKTVSLD